MQIFSADELSIKVDDESFDKTFAVVCQSQRNRGNILARFKRLFESVQNQSIPDVSVKEDEDLLKQQAAARVIYSFAVSNEVLHSNGIQEAFSKEEVLYVYDIDPEYQKNLDVLARITFAQHLVHFFESTLSDVISQMFTLDSLHTAAETMAPLKLQNLQAALSGDPGAADTLPDIDAIQARLEGIIPQDPIAVSPHVYTRQQILSQAQTYASIQLHNALSYVLPLHWQFQNPQYTFPVNVDPQEFISKFFLGGKLDGFYIAPIMRDNGAEVTTIKVEGSYNFSVFDYQSYIDIIKAEIQLEDPGSEESSKRPSISSTNILEILLIQILCFE